MILWTQFASWGIVSDITKFGWYLSIYIWPSFKPPVQA
jgi:hypothetical protein